MRRIAFVLVLLLCTSRGSSQELLVNGSFEEENICTEYDKNCAPEGWISNSLISNYYFNIPNYGIDGEHFVGLIAGNMRVSGKHTFVRSRLLCGLRKDNLYQLRFYVRSKHPVFDSIGVYFSSNDFLFEKRPFQQLSPSLVSTQLTAAQSDSWHKLEWVYKANGAETYITVGSFKKQEYEFRLPPEINGDYYLYIDCISLVPLDAHELLSTAVDSMKSEIYSENERHNLLQKKIAYYKKSPPVYPQPPVTEVELIDTLVIPDILFATASARLNPASSVVLDSFSRALTALPIDSVIVEGHTDSVGTLTYNNNLSMERAQSVATYLANRAGLPHEKLITRYFAFTRPVVANNTDEGRRRNRRVEIYVYRRERNRK